MLLFAVIPVALLAVYVLVQFRRRRRLHRFTEAPVPQPWWRHIPIAVSLLGLGLLTIALGTPTHDMKIPRNRAVIMLVIDMSQSMRATDVDPNRLKAAEQAAGKFAAQLTPGVNLGLVGFAGTPYLLVPPTPSTRRRSTRWASSTSPTARPPARRSSPPCTRSRPRG
jgi:Ca-activated chloride channel family protein